MFSLLIMDSYVRKNCEDVIEIIPYTEWSFIKPQPTDDHQQIYLRDSHRSATAATKEMLIESLDKAMKTMNYGQSQCFNTSDDELEGATDSPESTPRSELTDSDSELEELGRRTDEKDTLDAAREEEKHQVIDEQPEEGGDTHAKDLIHLHKTTQNGLVKSSQSRKAAADEKEPTVAVAQFPPQTVSIAAEDENELICVATENRRMTEPAASVTHQNLTESEMPGYLLQGLRFGSLDYPAAATKPRILSMSAKLIPGANRGILSNSSIGLNKSNLPKLGNTATEAGSQLGFAEKLNTRNTSASNQHVHAHENCEKQSSVNTIKSSVSQGGGLYPGGLVVGDDVVKKRSVANKNQPSMQTRKKSFHGGSSALNSPTSGLTTSHSRDDRSGDAAGMRRREQSPDYSPVTKRERDKNNARRSSLDNCGDNGGSIKPLIKSRSFTVKINNNTPRGRKSEVCDSNTLRRSSSEPAMKCTKPRIPGVIIEEDEDADVEHEDGAIAEEGSYLEIPVSLLPRFSISSSTSSSDTLRASPVESIDGEVPPSSTSPPISSVSPAPQMSHASSSYSRSNPPPSMSPNTRIPIVIVEDDEEEESDTEDTTDSCPPLASSTPWFNNNSSSLSASWPLGGGGLTVPTPEQTERLQMLADGAIKGSPFLSRRRGSNVSIAAEDNEDDLDELKALAARMNLQTRRPSYCVWKDKYINSRSLAVPKETEVIEEKEDSDEGVHIEEEDDDDWSLERKMKIDSALDWLKRELKTMRDQDKELARELMKIRQTIREIKLQRCTEENRETLEEAIEMEEDRLAFAELFDFVPEQFSPALKSAGVTKMNIHNRRFSVF